MSGFITIRVEPRIVLIIRPLQLLEKLQGAFLCVDGTASPARPQADTHRGKQGKPARWRTCGIAAGIVGIAAGVVEIGTGIVGELWSGVSSVIWVQANGWLGVALLIGYRNSKIAGGFVSV